MKVASAQVGTPSELELLAFSGTQTEALIAHPASVELPEHWHELEFPKITRHTEYQVVMVDGQPAIMALADHSASGLVRSVHYSLQEYPYLQWSWKISGTYKEGDLTEKSGDDYPARVYITFDTASVETSWWEEMQLKAYEMIYGARPPLATISYIWANKAPVGTLADNPYTRRVKMFVVNSGDPLRNTEQVQALNPLPTKTTGQWVRLQRNLRDDFIKAFGYEPPAVAAIAIMTDTDNTGEQTTAWYGPITASSQPMAAIAESP